MEPCLVIDLFCSGAECWSFDDLQWGIIKLVVMISWANM